VEACHNQKEKLVLYAYGELDTNSGKEIEDHLAICEPCRREYQSLLSLLGKIRETNTPPELIPQQVRSLVTDIKWHLNNKPVDKWWRRHLAIRPSRLLPAIATACILIITAGIFGHYKMNETRKLQPYADNQSEELMLSDRELEIVKNLELLKEMDAIQKLSRVVDLNGDINPHGEVDSETRGMRRDAYRTNIV
jgi:hypothetical protein